MSVAWRYVRLGDIARFVRGINFKPTDVVSAGTTGAVACMRTKNVQLVLDQSDVWFVGREFVKRSEQFLKAGDILVSSANSWNLVGKCSWIPELAEPATFGGFVSVIRAQNIESVSPRFLYRWFSSGRVQATVRSLGQQTTNISNLNTELCLNLQFPLPPLPEQKRISAILDKADELREKRRQALAKLDLLTQSLFLEMFGDPESNPMRFPTPPLSDSIHLRGGFAFKSTDYVPHGIPLVRIGEVNRGCVTHESACFLPLSFKTTHSRFIVRPGDMLMSLTGTTGKDDYGNVILLDEKFDCCLLNQRVALIEPDQESLDKRFLLYVLRDPRIKKQLTSTSRGIRQANISNHDVLELRVPIPPITLQHEFARRVGAVEKLKAAHKTAITKLDSLFASLQHRAFNGEL